MNNQTTLIQYGVFFVVFLVIIALFNGGFSLTNLLIALVVTLLSFFLTKARANGTNSKNQE